MADSCTMLRRVLVRTGTISMTAAPPAVVDQFCPTGEEWRTEPCGTPLFSDEERKRGTCRACLNGWTHEHNRPATEEEIAARAEFEAFRASGRDVPDIGAVTGLDYMNGRPGRVYRDDLYIERAYPDRDAWDLTIENLSWAGEPLAKLERELFDWARVANGEG